MCLLFTVSLATIIKKALIIIIDKTKLTLAYCAMTNCVVMKYEEINTLKYWLCMNKYVLNLFDIENTILVYIIP
jgi:hypothetical protein